MTHSSFQSKIIRVLNLWQKNNVFAPEVIQPLFDLANPDHPVHQAFMQQQQQQQSQQGDSNGLNVPRESPHQSQKEEQGGGETVRIKVFIKKLLDLTLSLFLF